jgi:hypothetical protein
MGFVIFDRWHELFWTQCIKRVAGIASIPDRRGQAALDDKGGGPALDDRAAYLSAAGSSVDPRMGKGSPLDPVLTFSSDPLMTPSTSPPSPKH